MSSKKPVIISYDAVSPLGIDLHDQWIKALSGQSGIKKLTRFPITEHFPVSIAGEVDDIDHLPYPFLQPREQARWQSPIFKYAMLTVQRALEKSGIEITPEIAPRVAVTYSSAIGGIDAILKAERKMSKENKLPHPFTNPNSCVNMVGGKIAIMTGAGGPITATITACATGVTSMIIGAMLIELGKADVVICGAADFALVEPIVAGFDTMNATFSPKELEEDIPPEQASRPFSVNRRGFVLSEGAGAVIIASEAFARQNGLHYTIGIKGWSMTSDAYHYVAPNLSAVQRCMEESIVHAGISPEDIDAVNAHAASTRVGDKVEFDAMMTTFKGKLPPVTANKSLIGHGMGASSAIESIFAMEGMRNSILPPTINYQADPSMELDCVAEGKRLLQQEFLLKNAFGFGGCNSCIVFQRIN